MKLANIFKNVTTFAAMYFGLLAIVTLTQDVITPILKERKVTKDARINSPAYQPGKDARQIYIDTAHAKNIYTPFVAWRHKPYQSTNVNIDTHGNRTHKPNPANDKNAKTVGFFGGSAMWGVGVKDNATIPAQFDHATPRFKAINYAERGYTSRQSLALLINLAATNKLPDVVVFHDGFADIWTLCNSAVTTRINGHIQERKIAAALLKATETSQFYNTFLAPLMTLAAKIRGKKKWPKQLACSSSRKRANAVAAALANNWQMAKLIAESRGSRFIAILQPNAYLTKAKVDYLNLEGSRKTKAVAQQVKLLYPLIKKALEQTPGLAFNDFSNIYDATQKPVFLDPAHLSPTGNQIQANKIAVILEQGH